MEILHSGTGKKKHKSIELDARIQVPLDNPHIMFVHFLIINTHVHLSYYI